MPLRGEAGNQILEPQRFHSAASEVEIANRRLNEEDSHQGIWNAFAKTRDWFKKAGVVALDEALAKASRPGPYFPAP